MARDEFWPLSIERMGDYQKRLFGEPTENLQLPMKVPERFDSQQFFDEVRDIANKNLVVLPMSFELQAIEPARPTARQGELAIVPVPPADLTAALAALDQTPGETASQFKLFCQVGPVPPANNNEAPPEPPGVVQLRADLGAVASAAAKVLGLLGCPFPGVHCLTFDAQGWRALIDAGDGKTWRLRAHVRGVDAHAATRAVLEAVASWLTTHSPAWRDRMPGEPLREALTRLIEALAAGYGRAGGSW